MPNGFHEEEVLGKAYDSRLMKRLLKYLVPYRLQVVASIALLIVYSLTELVGPVLTEFTINHIIQPRGSLSGQSGAISQMVHSLAGRLGVELQSFAGLNLIGALYLLALVISFFIYYCQIVLMQSVGQRIMFDLRRQIFSHLQELQISFYDKNPVGRLITRLTSDVDALNELFTSGVVAIFGDVFTLAAILIWMFYTDWRLALVSMTIVPGFIVLTTWFRIRVRETYREVRTRLARINAFLQERLSGMSVVQLFNREEKEMSRFEQINDRHRQANIKSIFYYAVFFPGVEIISSIGIGLIIWYGGGRIVRGTFTLGALIAFIQLAQRFYNPIRDISEKYNILQAAMASSERIFKLLDTEVTIKSPDKPKRLSQVRGAIEFRNVWFAYNNEDWILKDVSFKVEPGESIALVGHTGAGKTTITNLLLRFYDVQKGQILLDGVDIREFDLQWLRRNFSIVLQDVFLFSGDIESNIRLGDARISDSRVRMAAQEVHAESFIKQLPNGYSEEVKERGAGLSVGQKQLLAFARALCFDPRILILDEATSSIDTETELLIRDALNRLMRGRTSIIIAHRLSTIQSVDKIIVMHKGRIREMGSHQELLAQRGIYYRLYQLQYKEQEIVVPGD